MYRAIIILALLCIHVNVFSQAVTYNHDDSVTYNLYMTKSWDKLIDYEDKVNENTESYYTAFRIGAAYFEMSKYMPAVNYFEKALKKNKTDELAAEYLYYSYLYSGRTSDAKVKASKFSKRLKKKVNFSKPSFFDGFYTEGGYYVNNGYDEQKAFNTAGPPNIFGVQTLIKNYYYANFSLSHNIGTRLSLFHGFSYFNYSLTKQFTEKNNKVTNVDSDLKQKDYYFSFNYYLGKGYGLNGGFHFLNTTGRYADYEISNINDNISYVYSNSMSKTNEFAVSFSLEKSFTYAKLLASSSISNLNNAKQFQGGLTLTLFPLGNLDFYGYINSQYCTNGNDSGLSENHLVLTPGIGFKLSNHLWLEANYTIGDIYNYTDNNVFIINNNVDRINQKLNVKAILPVIYNKLELSLNFDFYNIDHTFISYINPQEYVTIINNNSNYKFIGGIKWSF